MTSSLPAAHLPRRLRAALAMMLFVAGVLALIYEVLWHRLFAAHLGSAATATATVLAAYFAGLGVGSFVVGRWGHRFRRPLRAYAGLELLVAVGALLTPWVLEAATALYSLSGDGGKDASALLLSARLLLALTAIGLPTFAMGGTLPLLGRFIDSDQRRLGTTAGWLYVTNTVGAAAGALLVPFVLLPQYGLRGATWLAVGGNLALAGVALALDRRIAAASLPANAGREARQLPTLSTVVDRLPLRRAAFVSGLATFALQVWWSRAFAQVHGNSLYAFAVIVASVVLALALGAQLARLALARGCRPARLLAASWIAGGSVALLSPWWFLHLSHQLDYLPTGRGALGAMWPLLELAGLCILPSMTLLGAALPALLEAGGRDPSADAGHTLGRIFSANIAGSVTGAGLAGFVLPPILPFWTAMLILGALLLAAGIGIGVSDTPRRRLLRWGVGGAAVAAGLALAAWSDLPRVHRSGSDERVLSVVEGAHGIVAVVDRSDSRRLKLNNHYALGGTASTGDERMQAHLPLLLHSNPREVAFLGVGTGITAGAALLHPVERVTAIELVPEVLAAARDFFAEENLNVVTDPRVDLHVDDARHYLRGTARRFDVVIGDLVVPWREGEGALYTWEHFAAARRVLRPGGLFCQWVPLFQLAEAEWVILARTFLAVFPHTWLWRGDFSPNEPALALIGTLTGELPSAEVVARRLRELQADPTNPHLQWPEAVWLHAVGVLEPSDLPSTETRLNRSDRPWIELLGPLHHGGEDTGHLMIGHRLERSLQPIRQRAASRWRDSSPDELALLASGETLARLILAWAEDDTEVVTRARTELRRDLPPPLYEQLVP